MGELLTIWSVRLAMGCCLGRYLVDATPPAGDCRRWQARWLWTVGCLLYLVHVVCACAFFHDWSHDRAYAHTAEQTLEVVGWNWGGGLYFNYLFTVVWFADVVWHWCRIDNGDRYPGLLGEVVHGFLAFMIINATCVFGPPFWKAVGVVFGLTMGLLLWIRWRGKPPAD
jgi:hypothetical protein